MESGVKRKLPRWLRVLAPLGAFFILISSSWAQDSQVRTESEDLMLEITKVSNRFKNSQMTSRDIEKFVPTDLEAGASGSQIMTRLADRSLQTLFSSEAVQSSIVGQTAHSVQQSMKMDTKVRAKEIDHRFTVNLLALQTSAKVEYTGYLSASLFHNVGAQQTDIQLSEKVLNNKKLYVNHSMKPTAQLSILGVSWNF